ncbi:MAG: pyrimidine-nucleoside phosphorylase [Candidatus Muiribacteriota bacterium]
MKMYDIIINKRNGLSNTPDEIKYIIKNYVEGKIPDYQISAWLMAVYFQNMTDEEAAFLTMEMAQSGDMMDLSPIKGAKIDKHSSGGVGDKTTLILGPLVASCGVKVAKMSGRGLGHTGGTLDKLESIPGFKVDVSTDDFFNIVNKTGLAVVGQTGNLAPADKKLYALRDVTATVDSIPLIAGSIMSKKLAAGNDGIVLDVKCGKGAFMQNLDDARKLASIMVEIGKRNGRNMSAVISDMNQPLGRYIGNALEVEESIQTLAGNGPDDLNELCYELGAEMLSLASIGKSKEERIDMLRDKISSGKALDKFREMIKAQGGNAEVCDNPSLMGKAKNIIEVTYSKSAYVKEIDALLIGKAAMLAGAGRETKEDIIDPTVGIILEKKVGDSVNPNECVAKIVINNTKNLDKIKSAIEEAFVYSQEPVAKNNLIYEIVR